MNRRSLAFVAFFVSFSALVRAQDAPGKWDDKCMMRQLVRMCADKPGTPAFYACAKQHNGDAAFACQKILDAEIAAAAPARTPAAAPTANPPAAAPAEFKVKASSGPDVECMAAMQQLCPGLQPGDHGGTAKCVMAHRGKLPPSCFNRGKPVPPSAKPAGS